VNSSQGTWKYGYDLIHRSPFTFARRSQRLPVDVNRAYRRMQSGASATHPIHLRIAEYESAKGGIERTQLGLRNAGKRVLGKARPQP
jgi:hypothetical protein